MATIRKRNGKWQVQIRRKAGFNESSTFTSRRDAERWAQHIEIKAERHDAGIDMHPATVPSLKDLIERYRRTILPLKRSSYQEGYILNALSRERFAEFPADQIQAHEIAKFRDRRLKEVSASTLIRTLGVLSHVFETAKTEWGIVRLINPVRLVRKPKSNPPRQRRLLPGEEIRLLAAINRSKNSDLHDVVQFAIATAMRLSEMIHIEWSDIDLDRRLIFLRITKNGRSRHVPLSLLATALVEQRYELGLPRLFPSTKGAIQQAWLRSVRRAGLINLHFHDLRHEAISRLFEAGLQVPEVALVSGHSDPRQLLRYTHLDAHDIVSKLDRENNEIS